MPFNYQRPGAPVDSADEKHGDGDSPDVDGCPLLPVSPPTDESSGLVIPAKATRFTDRLSSSGRHRRELKWDRGVHPEGHEKLLNAVRRGQPSSTGGRYLKSISLTEINLQPIETETCSFILVNATNI